MLMRLFDTRLWGLPAGSQPSSERESGWRRLLRIGRRSHDPASPLVGGVCEDGRCRVALEGLSRHRGRCVVCHRRWGDMPGGTPFSEFRGTLLLGFSIHDPDGTP